MMQNVDIKDVEKCRSKRRGNADFPGLASVLSFFGGTAEIRAAFFCVSQKTRTGADSTVTAAGSGLVLPARSFLRSIRKAAGATLGSTACSGGFEAVEVK